MKTLIALFGWFMFLIALAYIFLAFTYWNFNPSSYSLDDRQGAAGMAAMIWFITAIFIVVYNDKNK